MGPKSTTEWQDDQVCAGLKQVTDGYIHGIQDIWDKYASTENWDFTFVEAKNTFNEIYCIGIIWNFVIYGHPKLLLF